jgi:hypothetical protein
MDYQKYAAYDAEGKLLGFYSDEISPVPVGVNAIKITTEEWQAAIQDGGQHIAIKDGKLVFPSDELKRSLAEASRAAGLKAQARAALDASDLAVIRAYELAQPVPKEVVDYREQLREVVRGSSTDLPIDPRTLTV